MLAPVGRLSKKEIVYLSKNRCKHGHTYLEHYSCFISENPFNEKIGFFDTENSSLNADFGIMLCWCIKERNGNILQDSITKRDLETSIDKRIVTSCIETMKKFDRIVTYYGKRYDFPFLRTRALVNNVPFFNYGEMIHDDIYFIIKYKFKFSHNRLENACRSLVGETEKTHIDPMRWIKAMRGEKQALDWILDHCKRDVRDLERLYEKVYMFEKPANRSI